MAPTFVYAWMDDSLENIREPGEYIIETETDAVIDEHGNLIVTYKMKNARKKEESGS